MSINAYKYPRNNHAVVGGNRTPIKGEVSIMASPIMHVKGSLLTPRHSSMSSFPHLSVIHLNALELTDLDCMDLLQLSKAASIIP